jgi:hypothetical protein
MRFLRITTSSKCAWACINGTHRARNPVKRLLSPWPALGNAPERLLGGRSQATRSLLGCEVRGQFVNPRDCFL